jgi:hypothetical protein
MRLLDKRARQLRLAAAEARLGLRPAADQVGRVRQVVAVVEEEAVVALDPLPVVVVAEVLENPEQ